ncbi:MAG: LytTR family DNA-binding domain-containing protein [Acidobacteriota bacterium]
MVRVKDDATKTIGALIVDDEPPARRGLCALLDARAGWRVLGEAATGPSALGALETLTPDVVFLDICMPGLDGLAVARALRRWSRPPLVVFTTAFEEHALAAFEVEAVDYLLKPFDDERFALSAGRVERLLAALTPAGRGSEAETPRSQSTPRSGTRSLAVRSVGRVRLVDVAEIQWVAAAGNYVRLYLGGRCLLHRATLASLEATLDPDAFVRIHRSTLVHRDQVVELRTPIPGRAQVVLRDGTELEVSQRHRRRAFALLVP